MTWLSSFFVGVLSGVAGLLISGLCASLAIEWYRISSFEGGSGYFAVALALLGGIAAFIIGIVVARTSGVSPTPSFLRALGTAVGIVLVLNGAVAGVARLLADVPPEIDGKQLLLAFELRWPESEQSDPRTLPDPRATLGVTSGGSIRKTETGALMLEDARFEAGRWIAPGAVRLFTSRGKPLLLTEIGGKSLGAFLLPLASHPTPKNYEWSEWMPRARPGAPPLPDSFQVRFRVIKTSEPFRKQVVGPFTIGTVGSYFAYWGAGLPVSVTGSFQVAYKGKVVDGLQELSAVYVVGGNKPALLVAGAQAAEGGTDCVLVLADGDSLVRANAGSCQSLNVRHISNDPKLFANRRKSSDVRGWLDFTTVSTPGLYKLDATILDTRRYTVSPFAFPDGSYPPDPPGILALSPDEHSVVWFQMDPPALGVTNYVANQSYILPIDRDRMRYGAYEHLDPAWVDHHFMWVRNAAGSDTLAQRPSFTPLPHRGDLTRARPGEFQSWQLKPGSEAIRDLVLQILTTQLEGELLPQSETSVSRQVKIDGKMVDVFLYEVEYVSVSMSGKDSDPALMERVGQVLDAELATGKHDALFARQVEK